MGPGSGHRQYPKNPCAGLPFQSSTESPHCRCSCPKPLTNLGCLVSSLLRPIIKRRMIHMLTTTAFWRFLLSAWNSHSPELATILAPVMAAKASPPANAAMPPTL